MYFGSMRNEETRKRIVLLILILSIIYSNMHTRVYVHLGGILKYSRYNANCTHLKIAAALGKYICIYTCVAVGSLFLASNARDRESGALPVSLKSKRKNTI